MRTQHYFFLFLFLFSFLFAAENNISIAKLSLQCSYNNEIIELAGLLNNQNSINKIIQLLESVTLSSEASPEPFIYRYPYDINYSDTNAAWDTIVASTNFFQQKVQSIAWFPDGNKLIAVGNTKAGSSGIIGRIYSFSENGSALYNDGKYTMTWGGLNSTSLTVSAVAIHPGGNYFMIGGVRTPAGVTHRLIYLDETITSTVIVQDLDHGSTVRSIDWSPSGKYVAIAGETSNNINVRIYRFEFGRLTELPRCQFLWNATLPAYSIKWHPSGNFLLLSGGRNPGDNNLQILSFNHESIHFIKRLGTATFVGHDPETIWSPDGTKAITIHNSAAFLGPAFGTFINGLTFKDSFYGSITANQFYSASISPDGAYYSVSRDNNIDTYEDPIAGTGLNISTLNYAFATSRITKIRWNPDGNFLAFSAENGDIKVLKLNENPIVLAKRIKKELLNMYQPAFQMYNTTQNIIQPLSTANSNAFVKYAAQTPITYTKTGTQTFGDSTNMRCMDWSPDGNYLAFGGDYLPQLYIYARNGNLLDIVQSLTFGVANIAIDSIRFAPNGKYIAVSNLGNNNTKILSFNGEYAKELVSTATAVNHIEWFPDSSTLLLNGGIFSFTGTALFALDNTYRKSATLDKSGRYFAYISAPNILVIAQYLGNTVTTVTSTPISSIEAPERLYWNTPSIIAAWSIATTPTIAVYQFDGTSLTIVGTTLATGPFHANIDNELSLDSSGQHFIFSRIVDPINILEFATNAPSGPLIQVGSISNIGAFIYALRYSPDNNYIAAAGTNNQRNAMLFTRETTPPLMSLSSTYTVIKGTSDNITAYQALIMANSYSSIPLDSLAVDNSNVLVTKDPLIKANSNVVAGLLLATSQAIRNFVIPNSQAIITKNNLIVANSYTSINLSNFIIANSQVLVTYQPLIINNSNATAGLLVATSNATAGLLVATSNAVAGLLVATSNATAGLLVTTSQAANAIALKALALDTIDAGPAHIHFNTPIITMTYNVLLSTDHQLFVHMSGVVNGNGHSITFAKGSGTQLTIDPGITTTFENVIFKDYNDQAVSLGAGSSFIFGHQARVELSESQTLLRTWSFGGISQLNGLGNALTLGTGPLFLSTLVSSSLQLSNIKLLNVRENNLRAASNNVAINFQDVVLNMSADFTYSIGSMRVQNDVTLRGTSTFNYTTIMGCTINSASQLTLDSGVSFNYAPAGNFRNLLSLTDSSARLYCNSASLVATATGPQLTKGTLLVDGIMQIQSAAASTAEAVVFGDLTPENDLIIKLFPCATINVMSGYLNYANAQ